MFKVFKAQQKNICLIQLKLSVFCFAVAIFFIFSFKDIIIHNIKSNGFLPSASKSNHLHSKPNSNLIDPILEYLPTTIYEKIQSPSETVKVKNRNYSNQTFLRQVATSDSFLLNKSINTLDFDEFVDDRILLQREWMKNVFNSENFANLKPKRILLNGDFKYYYKGTLKCPIKARGWESKFVVIENKDPRRIFSDNEMKTFDAVIQLRNGDTAFEQIYEKAGENPSIKVNFMLESPFVNGNSKIEKALLASYWRGSDIVIPYYKWAPFKNHTRMSNSKPALKNFALGKTKLAAIVVSNCNPQNARLEYVKMLQQNVTVDVYGKCGEFKCTECCYETLGKKYKFYLAFENANCRDYITEKFFRNALLNNMVPVVLGAHKRDYLYAAPPNSFIHVEDFKSPAELAAYLLKLDSNDELYNAYFSWRDTGEVYKSFNEVICRICAALFMADEVRIPDWPPNTTFAKVNLCLPRKRWYWDQKNF